MRKKRIGFVTNSAVGIKTGFQRNAAALLSYLYKTDKYEIFHLVQSFHEDEPKLKMQPWHSKGVFNNEIAATEQFQKDGNFQRIVSYGNMAVGKWVLENELDCLAHVEDIWSSTHDMYWKQDWFEFLKQNFIQHTTLDSTPILPDALTWMTKTPNFWCWSDFAELEAKKLDPTLYGHVKTVYGTLNCDEFKLMSTAEKSELRKKFGIPEEDILVCQVSRNQLRKLFHSNMEGLAKYKKLYSGSKRVRLLFHTSWPEPGGWPLERIRDEVGLEKDDVLATYFCQQCANWSINPFLGEPLKCPHCGKDHAYITAGITSTIDNVDLAKIYGICDGMSHCMTSGGLEYSIVEGLLCGLVTATVGYSSGLTFTNQSFVEEIDFNLTREVGTAFNKAVPNPNSVAKFFKKLVDMSPEKRREIGNKGRQYILNNFHMDVIGKKFEEFFDSCQPLDWSNYHTKKKDYDQKIPDAPIPQNIENDVEFIQILYKNILKMDQPADDPGLIGWVNYFQNLPPGLHQERLKVRAQIEQSFRQIAHNENQKANPVDFKSFIDFNTGKKRGIFVIKESGGDIFCCTSLFKSFHEKYKDYQLYLMCDPKYADILAGNEYVYKVLPWFEPATSEMFCISAGQNKEEQLFHWFGYPAVSTQKWLSYLSHENAGEIA